MAIDWNKPLGSSASSAASAALPSKKTMNLLVKESKRKGAGKYVAGALALALLVGLFAKFAVLDVFSQVDLKRNELNAVQQELSAVQKQADNYDAVLEEYHSYTGVDFRGATDSLAVMDMVAKVVQPQATITAVSVSNGLMQVNVKDVSLDSLGKLADQLRAQEMVETVTVANASDAESNNVTATLQVALSSSDNEGGAQHA